MMRIFFISMVYIVGMVTQIMLQTLLPLPWAAVSLPLCLLPTVVHFGIVHEQQRTLPAWYALAGAMLEITSPYPFGGYILMCVFSAFFVQWFFQEFITNISLLSFIFLLILSIGIYYLVQLLFLLGTGTLLNAADSFYFLTTHGNVIIATAVFSICSYLLAFFIGRKLMHTHA